MVPLRITAFLLVVFVIASSADARIFGRKRYRYYYYTNTTANWQIPADDKTLSEVPVSVQKPDQTKEHHKPDQVAHHHHKHHYCHHRCCHKHYYKRCCRWWRRCCY